MASPSPTTTTRARSIQTLDGYVSRGRAPPSSVPRDHATLQDFAAFLELRLKSQNVSLLRRVFADFLNEQEHTLVPLMRQGVSIITVFPVLRTNPQRRRQAQRLLAKPKSHLDPRGCVFLYLQYRAATRNMALLKHMFLEFVGHKEASLLRFVERGNEVISVIPFELPRVVLPAPAPAAPAPAEAAPEQQLVESPRAVEAAVEQPVEAERKRRKTRSKERKNVRPAEPKELATASAVSSEKQRAEVSSNPGANQGKRERRKKVETQDDAPATPAAATAPVATLQPDVAVAAEPERVQNKRRSRRLSAAAVASAVASTTTESAASEQDHQENTGATASSGSGDADASQVKRGRRKKVGKKDNCVAATAASVPVAIQQQVVTEAVDPERVVKRRSRRISDAAAAANTEPAVNEGNQESSVPDAPSAAVESAPARGEKPKSSTASQEKAAATPVEAVAPQAAGTPPTTATPVEAPQDPPKAKRGRKRKAEADKQKDGSHTAVKSHKRGKPVMSEAMCRSQEQLTRKMEAFEAQIPWEAVFGNLPLPFEEEKHPELAKKLHRFWHKHSRAVWERKFWAPMSRKMNAFAFNKRNNRQISAKNAFETIILAAYEQLGAAFFVRLDMQQPRHPGWWYRSPVVALFALQEVKGEDAVWDYVKNDALERFPDCKLPIPIKAPNYGAVQNCHKSASESMWMANHPLTPTWLGEIAALKAKQQAHGTSGEEAGVSQPSRGPDREPENVMTVMDALGFT